MNRIQLTMKNKQHLADVLQLKAVNAITELLNSLQPKQKKLHLLILSTAAILWENFHHFYADSRCEHC